MAENTTLARFAPGDNISRAFPNLWQWSRGQVLQIEGLTLPASYTVHFSNSPFGYDPDTEGQIGDAEGVDVPDSMLQSGQPVYAWIWLSETTSAETAAQVIIEVNRRAQPPNYEPTPEEETIIDEAIAALNEGVEKADADALKAEGFALGTQDGEPVTDESPYYENNAEYMRDAAAGYALQADSFSGEAAAWATGSYSGGGMPVPDDAPQHNNNAKYYSQQAAAAQQAIEALSVLAESLGAGSSATVTKTVDPGTGAVTITFGIPIGDTGATGNGISSVTLNPDYTLTISYTNGDSVTTTSIRGATGATPNLTIGTVTTGAPGSSAAATITGTAENPVLNLTIPQGNTGDPGEVPAAALASTQASTTASEAIAEGEYFWLSGSLYIATAAIASGGTITVGTNCKLAKLADDVSDLKSALTNVEEATVREMMTVNLLHGAWVTGKLITSAGIESDNSNYSHSDYCELYGGSYVIATRQATSTTRMNETSCTIAFYDSSKTFISRSADNVKAVPSNAKYFIVNCQNAYLASSYKLMVEYTNSTGSQKSSEYSLWFEPYTALLANYGANFGNKKLCVFGDSLAANGNGGNNAWINVVGDTLGFSAVYNRGVGASRVTPTETRYAYVDADGDAYNRASYDSHQTIAGYTEIDACCSSVDRANTIPTDTDVLIVLAGANDPSNTTVADFKTAYGTMLDNIYARIPNAKILCGTLLYNRAWDSGQYASTYNDYRNAIRDVANLYGYPVIEFRREMQVNDNNYATFMDNDGAHYNSKLVGINRIAETAIPYVYDIKYIT